MQYFISKIQEIRKKKSSLGNFQDNMVGGMQPIDALKKKKKKEASSVTITSLQTLASETCGISTN